MRENKNNGILIISVALFFLVIQISLIAKIIASKGEKRLEVTALKENEEIVALLKGSSIQIDEKSGAILKKLVDPNNPQLKLIDDIYKVDPKVGKLLYSQFRNGVKEQSPRFIESLDMITNETEKLINGGETDEAQEYFNGEIRRITESIPNLEDDFVDNLIKLEIKANDWLAEKITYIKPKTKVGGNTKTIVESDTTDKF